MAYQTKYQLAEPRFELADYLTGQTYTAIRVAQLQVSKKTSALVGTVRTIVAKDPTAGHIIPYTDGAPTGRHESEREVPFPPRSCPWELLGSGYERMQPGGRGKRGAPRQKTWAENGERKTRERGSGGWGGKSPKSKSFCSFM